jgi:hypothetical protein
LRLDPLDVARAALVLCRLVWLLRASAARRGGQLGGDPAMVARVGFDLAGVVRITDDLGALLRLAAELMVGRAPDAPPRPPKASR